METTKCGMDFHYDAAGVDECAPLLYLWTIHNSAGHIYYCYVGKSNAGAARPKKSYLSVVKRLQRGGPYRPNNPTYREVHQRMAEAVEKGFIIRLRLIRNVLDSENILAAEAEARKHFSELFGVPCG
jgi:hypothetical protein